MMHPNYGNFLDGDCTCTGELHGKLSAAGSGASDLVGDTLHCELISNKPPSFPEG